VKSRTRRVFEMGRSVVAFSEGHPDSSAGYATTLSRLKDRLARASALINLQQGGFAAVREATKQKLELRRIIQRSQLKHVVRVAELAAAEVPGLLRKFVLPREQTPYLEFQAAAHAILAEALNQKELLVKHGLAETLLEDLVKNVESFDQAVQQGTDSRQGHVTASAELDAIGDEIVHLVKVMDTLNRSRFHASAELLAGWESASNVFGPVVSREEQPASPKETPSGGGESKTVA
jgi:DNA repair exonuclease SbcCD ATPase subunit